MTDFFSFLPFTLTAALLLKGVLIIMTFLFTVFAFVLFTQVRSLNKIVYIDAKHTSFIIQSISVILLIVSISLFFVSLVIL